MEKNGSEPSTSSSKHDEFEDWQFYLKLIL